MYGAYLSFKIASIALFILCAYCVYCMIDLIIVKHNVKHNKTVHKHMNIFRLIFGVDRRLKEVGGSEAKDDRRFKKKRKRAHKFSTIFAIIFLVIALVLNAIASALNTLNTGLTTAATIIQALVNEEKNIGAADDDWVDKPDEPDNPDESNSSGSTTPNGPSGAQDGDEYAVQFEDGEWCYWYHQTSSQCGCKYCGNWTDAYWGSPTDTTYGIVKFGSDGCAFYSLAIAVSNVLGKAITPLDAIQTAGAVWNSDSSYSGGGFWNTNPPGDEPGFSGGHGIARTGALNAMANKYGIKYSDDLCTGDINSTCENIDSYLEKGAYIWIWYKWQAGELTNPGKYESHFVCIRKKVGDKYVIIDECQKGKDLHATKEQLENAGMLYGGIYAIWTDKKVEKPGPKPSEPSEKLDLSDSDWYTNITGKLPASTSNKIIYSNDIYEVKLYNGVPDEWMKDSSDVYIANIEVMLKDTYSFMKTYMDVDVKETYKNHMLFDTSQYCNTQGISSFISMSTGSIATYNDTIWNGTGTGQLANVDGLWCPGVALADSILNRTHTMSSSGEKFPVTVNGKIADWLLSPHSSNAGSYYDYGEKKLLMILEDSSGDKWYLPTTTCDAKGATFPGDFAQTGVTLETNSELTNGKSVTGTTYSDIVFPCVSVPLTGSGYTKFNARNAKLKDLKALFDGLDNFKVTDESHTSAIAAANDTYVVTLNEYGGTSYKWNPKEELNDTNDTIYKGNGTYKKSKIAYARASEGAGCVAEFYQVPPKAADELRNYTLVGIMVWD